MPLTTNVRVKFQGILEEVTVWYYKGDSKDVLRERAINMLKCINKY